MLMLSFSVFDDQARRCAGSKAPDASTTCKCEAGSFSWRQGYLSNTGMTVPAVFHPVL